MSTAVTALRVHPDKYKKNFDIVVIFLTQYIDKRAPILSVKVASVTQTRPAKWQKTNASCITFKGNIELKKYSERNVTQCWQHSTNSCMSSKRKLDS